MQDKFNQFFNLYNGKSIEFSDPTNKFQCMDGAGKWCEFLGIPYEAIRHLHAYQVWTQPTDLTRKYFDLVPNGPTNITPVGALVVFGQSVGPSGHISIGEKESNSKDCITFDQNWSGKQFMTTVNHVSYKGVLGWLVPKDVKNWDIVVDRMKAALNAGGTSENRAKEADKIFQS